MVLGEFLGCSSYTILNVQSAGTDVPEDIELAGLYEAVARAGQYQIWIRTTQDSCAIAVTVHHVRPEEELPPLAGTIVFDQVVDFYDATVCVIPLAGVPMGEFALPEGEGRYRVVIATDVADRAAMMRAEQRAYADVPGTTREQRLHRLDGRERYELAFRYVEPIPDDED